MKLVNIKKPFLKYFTIRIICFICFLYFMNDTNAQESCTKTLENAQTVFSSGQIEEVPGILNACLQKGFNKQERIEAYRLLTLCHLYYNRMDSAAKTLEILLKIDPEYKLRDTDPSELRNLHKAFRTTPVVIFGAKLGVGKSDLYTIRNHNDINSTEYEGEYKTQTALMAGISLEIPIIAELSIVSEFYLNNKSYNYKRTLQNYTEVDFRETMTGIEAPLLVQWNILKDKRAVPYINAGGSAFLLYQSKADVTRTDKSGTSVRIKKTNASINITDSRTRFNFAATLGAGVRIKDVIGRGYITADLKYSLYFIDHVSADNRNKHPELTYSFLHTDNPFGIQSVQFLIGFKHPFYIPKLKKSARPE